MRVLLIVVLVVVAVLGVQWVMDQRSVQSTGREAKADVREAVRDAKDAVADIDVDGIKDELARTGRVVRRKVVEASKVAAEVTEDARTTAKIKTKLALDPDLSALDVSVDTTDGRVTLAGRVDSPELVARAMRLALAEDGVREVVSTLQVRGLALENQKVTETH